MSNSVQPGKVLDLTATVVTSVNDLVQIGMLMGIALNDAAIGERLRLAVDEVFEVPRENQAFAEGDPVYYFVGNKSVTTTPGTKFVGHAVETLGAGTTPIKVRLQQAEA